MNGTGITYQELKAGSVATIVFGLAIVFVFLILAAQYESWTMPFMVLFAVPLALFGALTALWIRGMEIDVYSQIGFVHADRSCGKERDPDRGGSPAAGARRVLRSSKRRWKPRGCGLRPILMTAFAFILGVVPLMIASGAGAASRESLGTTVFGGMLAATILTLIFVPVFYAVIETMRERYMGAERPLRAITTRLRNKFGEVVMRHLKIGVIATVAIAVVATGVVFFLQGQGAGRRYRRRGDAAAYDGHAGAGDQRPSRRIFRFI